MEFIIAGVFLGMVLYEIGNLFDRFGHWVLDKITHGRPPLQTYGPTTIEELKKATETKANDY